MITQLITPTKSKVQLNIPEEYLNQQIQIIIFPFQKKKLRTNDKELKLKHINDLNDETRQIIKKALKGQDFIAYKNVEDMINSI
jgi:hypothetical protein